MITIEQIKRIAEDIIADDEWVNDSHSGAEHQGVKMGLEMLVRHLQETNDETWFHKADKKLIDGFWFVKITDINLQRSK
jgi:hypothetical protein